MIQIYTNFGWLKWLHTKRFSIWVIRFIFLLISRILKSGDHKILKKIDFKKWFKKTIIGADSAGFSFFS
jgi:hypothetical protein